MTVPWDYRRPVGAQGPVKYCSSSARRRRYREHAGTDLCLQCGGGGPRSPRPAPPGGGPGRRGPGGGGGGRRVGRRGTGPPGAVRRDGGGAAPARPDRRASSWAWCAPWGISPSWSSVPAPARWRWCSTPGPTTRSRAGPRAREVAARVRAVRRRSRPTDEEEPIRVGHLLIDPARREARLDRRALDLSRKEFDLLHALARRRGRVASRRDLLAEVWEQPLGGPDKTLDVHLSWLRQKLGETGASPRYLHTVRGVGRQADRSRSLISDGTASSVCRLQEGGVVAPLLGGPALGLAVEDLGQGRRHLGVELAAGAALHFLHRRRRRQGRSIGAMVGHGVEGVGHLHDAGHHRQGAPVEAAGVALAVHALVVVEDGCGHLPLHDVGDQAVPFLGMGPHHSPLRPGEARRLPEDGLGDGQLAHVVQEAGGVRAGPACPCRRRVARRRRRPPRPCDAGAPPATRRAGGSPRRTCG